MNSYALSSAMDVFNGYTFNHEVSELLFTLRVSFYERCLIRGCHFIEFSWISTLVEVMMVFRWPFRYTLRRSSFRGWWDLQNCTKYPLHLGSFFPSSPSYLLKDLAVNR
jgi:hypothetical protein